MAYDVILRGGTLYDGSGGQARRADVAVLGDQVAAVGELRGESAALEIDVRGWQSRPASSTCSVGRSKSLIEDGRSQSEIRQGVTLEVMGEGTSMGPLSAAMKAGGPRSYLATGRYSVRRRVDDAGRVSRISGAARRFDCNIASFVGVPTLRVHDDRLRRPSADGRRTGAHVRLAASGDARRRDGHVRRADLSACFLRQHRGTDRAGESGGRIRRHVYLAPAQRRRRSSSKQLDELIRIAREAGTQRRNLSPQSGGSRNWRKMDEVIPHVEAARAEGLHDHRRYVYVPGRRHRPERLHPALGARRRR